MTENPGFRATTEVDPQRGSRSSRTDEGWPFLTFRILGSSVRLLNHVALDVDLACEREKGTPAYRAGRRCLQGPAPAPGCVFAVM